MASLRAGLPGSLLGRALAEQRPAMHLLPRAFTPARAGKTQSTCCHSNGYTAMQMSTAFVPLYC